MALVHGAPPVRLFCPSAFHFICGISPSELIVGEDEVEDCDVRDFLNKVCCH